MQLSAKNKIIIISSVFSAVLITVIILLFTLFALDSSEIKINFLNASIFENNQVFKEQLFEKSEIKNKTSVFFINKKKATKKIEEEFPYIKVVNIETVFPNNLIFNVAEREELYAIKNHLDNYFLLDGDFKVLKVVSLAEFETFEIKPILIEFEGANLDNIFAGSFLPQTDNVLLFKNLAKSFLVCSRDVFEQKTLFKNIVFSDNMLVLFLQDNFEIKIHNAKEELHLKTQAMFVRMGQIYPTYQNNYCLEIYMTQDKTLLSKFTLKN